MPKAIGMTNTGRKGYKSKQGEFYSEKSITVTHPKINKGRATNIPSVFKGKQKSEKDAISLVSRFTANRTVARDPETDKPLKSYRTISEAVKAAKKKSKNTKLIKPIN